MRFLLVSIGSMGDTFPFVTVGEALKRRGHEVFICCNGQFQKFVESRGLQFVESLAASEYQTFIENQKHWSQRRALKGMGEILINQVEKVYHAIADHHIPGQTVVAAQGYAVGARVAQEKLGIPTATVHLQPLWFRSIHNHPELADWCPLWFPRAIDRILDFFIDRNIGRPVNAFRATLGLAPMNYVLKYWWNSPDLVMGLFPSWYESPQPDWPKNVLLTGFPVPPYNPELFDSREVEAFLNAGDRPIVFNQSSVTLDDRYFAICAEVARKVGRRAIFLTPHQSQLPADLPNTIKSFPFVPLEWLLPRSALHVHHGGVGTIAHSLAAGVPQLIVPGVYDQLDNSLRIERVGGARLIRRKQFRLPAVVKAVQELLDSKDVAEKCKEFAARCQADRGLDRACEALEQLGSRGGKGDGPRSGVTASSAAR